MSHQRMPNAKLLPLRESQVEKSLLWVTVVLLISFHHLANEKFLFSPNSYRGSVGRDSTVSKPTRCASNEHQSQHPNTWWMLWLFTFLEVEK